MSHRLIDQNSTLNMWEWSPVNSQKKWIIVAKHSDERVIDFFVRVLYGRTNERNSHLRKFGESYEGVFPISEMEMATDFFHTMEGA